MKRDDWGDFKRSPGIIIPGPDESAALQSGYHERLQVLAADTSGYNMTPKQFILIISVVMTISVGQLLFKRTASMLNTATNGLWALFNPYLITAFAIYGLATLAWVYILRQVPLSLAYPLFALSFLFVPLLSTILFREPFTLKMLAGSAAIVFGVYLFNS